MNKNLKKSIEDDPCQRAWIEVSPSAIEGNTRAIGRLLTKGTSLMAVVKADGYGHGATTVARAALRGGARELGVATLKEGIELRKAGLEAPILLLGNLYDSDELEACLKWNLTVTLSSIKEAILCENLASGKGRNFQVQLKLDTGMARLGCDLEDTKDFVERIEQFRYVQLKGIYSHLALADAYPLAKATLITELQKNQFDSVMQTLSLPQDKLCLHLANSAGTLRSRSLHYDMVRVGLALYGYSPIDIDGNSLDLRPSLAVKARVTFLRDVPAGVGVSYGHTFVTSRPSRLAVVGIGYADGISRSLSGKIFGLFSGQLVPQVGSITMDQLVLDVTDHPDIEVGSVITMLGKDGEIFISPQQWSHLSGSIPWEVLCGFKHRLPRVVI